jgi:radical SAM-linked protein
VERPSGEAPALPVAPRPPDPVQRWRLTVRRRPDAPVVAQRDWQAALEAALVGTGLPLAMTDGGAGGDPRPRVAIAAPLAPGTASEGELLDLLLLRRLPIWEVRDALTAALPAGHELIGLEDVWLGEPAVAGRVIAADYELPLEGEASAALTEAVAAVLVASALPRRRTRGERTVDYDLRPFIEALEVSGTSVRMRLRHDPEKGVGRPEEVLAELSERTGTRLEPSGVVRTGLVLAPLRAVAGERSSAPRAPGRPRADGVARPQRGLR